MATLYVRNVPDDLYDALRRQAKHNRRSMAAEVIELLEQNIPTEAELKRRTKLFEEIRALQKKTRRGRGKYQSAEEMIREMRGR